MGRKRCPPEQMISLLRQARDRVAGARGRGEGPADAEVGGEGQEAAGCRSRLRRGSNGHLKVYANPWRLLKNS